MAKRLTKDCPHCFHVVSSTTDGMGVTGWDDEKCCRCGGEHRQFWRWIADPAHGSHVESRMRVYEKS